MGDNIVPKRPAVERKEELLYRAGHKIEQIVDFG